MRRDAWLDLTIFQEHYHNCQLVDDCAQDVAQAGVIVL